MLFGIFFILVLNTEQGRGGGIKKHLVKQKGRQMIYKRQPHCSLQIMQRLSATKPRHPPPYMRNNCQCCQEGCCRHRPLPHPYHRYPNSQPQSPPPYLRNKCQHRKSITLSLTHPKVCPPAHAQGHKHHFLGTNKISIFAGIQMMPLSAQV